MTDYNPANVISPAATEVTRLLAPGEASDIAISGDFCSCVEATADFDLGFNSGPKTNFRKGYKRLTNTQFNSVQIVNKSVAQNTVTLMLGMGDFVDGRLTISGGIMTTETVSSTFLTNIEASVGAGASNVLFVANANRRVAIIKNTGGGRVWILDSAALSARGHPLDPGETVPVASTAAIYAFNQNGFAVTVARWELEQ